MKISPTETSPELFQLTDSSAANEPASDGFSRYLQQILKRDVGGDASELTDVPVEQGMAQTEILLGQVVFDGQVFELNEFNSIHLSHEAIHQAFMSADADVQAILSDSAVEQQAVLLTEPELVQAVSYPAMSATDEIASVQSAADSKPAPGLSAAAVININAGMVLPVEGKTLPQQVEPEIAMIQAGFKPETPRKPISDDRTLGAETKPTSLVSEPKPASAITGFDQILPDQLKHSANPPQAHLAMDKLLQGTVIPARLDTQRDATTTPLPGVIDLPRHSDSTSSYDFLLGGKDDVDPATALLRNSSQPNNAQTATIDSINIASQVDKPQQLGLQTPNQLTPELQPISLGQARSSIDLGDGLGDRVAWMINQKMNSATVRIDPPMLGKLEIHIKLNDDVTTITINTQHAQTRDLIDNASNRLRDLLQDSGYANVNVDVSHRQGQQQAQSGSSESENSEVDKEANYSEDIASEGRPANTPMPAPDALVDYFA